MQKGVFGIVFLSLLILSIFSVSAFSVSDMFKTITGNAIVDGTSFKNSKTCTDSDGGIYFSKTGTVNAWVAAGRGVISRQYKDSCSGTSKLIEYYCGPSLKSVTTTCASGCSKGACIEETPTQTPTTPTPSVNDTPIETNSNIDPRFKDQFPNQIVNFTLASSREDGEDCEGSICIVSLSAEYRNSVSGNVVFVKLWNLTSGTKDDLKDYLISNRITPVNVGDSTVYRLEKHELLWFTSLESPVLVFTQEGNITVLPDQTNYNYGTATGDNPVTRAFLAKYSSDKITINPVITNPVCSDLINYVAYPRNITLYGVEYRNLGSWNYSGENWIDSAYEKYDEYISTWYSTTRSEDDDVSNQYMNVYTTVFENDDINLAQEAENALLNDLCTIGQYYDNKNGKMNTIYTCIYRNSNDGSSNSVYRDVHLIWFNENVLNRVHIFEAKSISASERNELRDKSNADFLSHLQDNKATSVKLDEFSIPYPSSDLFNLLLPKCSSTITPRTYPGTNDTCYPNWECKTEPSVCPEYGSQKRTCTDTSSCGLPSRVETLSCSPGICSGCYTPRFFGYSNGGNVCIPYGTRLTQSVDSSTDRENELIDIDSDGEVATNLTVINDNTAYLLMRDYGFDSYIYEGSTYSIIDPDRPSEFIQFKVSDIVKGENFGDGYIDFTLIGNFDAYCDIDGQIKAQKLKLSDGTWASCQNNYECESNFCSAGECIEIKDAITQAKGFKGTFVKAICRLANLFDQDEYESCVVELSN